VVGRPPGRRGSAVCGSGAAKPERRFLIGGAQYPQDFPWAANIYFVRHLPPAEHPAFFSSSRLTLNVTREAMAEMGWCPSGRLFEAAACGAPLLSDSWDGLDAFFTPGEEILVTRNTADTMSALAASDWELQRMAGNARDRVLAEHTSQKRAGDFLSAIDADQGAHRSRPRNGERLTCGASFRPPAAAAASSRSPSPRSSCLSAAAWTTASNAPAPSANTWSNA
jgi:spore maturation protein CgeB